MPDETRSTTPATDRARRLWLRSVCFAALLWLPLTSGCRPLPLDFSRLWARFEVTLPLAVEASNPFDPDEVEVWAEFWSHDGAVLNAPGFVYRPYQSELRDGAEQLTPTGDLEWRIRFTPNQRGFWAWRWVRRTSEGDETGPWRFLVVGRDRENRHGFVRRSPDDSRYLRFDDGSPFFSVGVNLGWYGSGGTFDYERWMDRYAAEGVNVIRIWMPRWAMSLFNDPADLRNWTERMDRAWQLDRIFELAEQRGMKVMLVLLNHGAFSESFNSGWHLNPFNAANGGPLQEPLDVWTDPEGRRILQNLFRYVAARWGHSTALLCWELWNEANLTSPAGSTGAPLPMEMDDVVAWHREMAQALAAADPNDHLVSTSSSDWLEALFTTPLAPELHVFREVWEMPEIDFAQLHLYQALAAYPQPFFSMFRNTVPVRRPVAGGPVLVAEAGVDSAGPGETLFRDPEGEGFHDLLWAAPFSEAFGTGMPWWWDNLTEPEDRYFHFGPLARLLRDVAFDREGFASVDIPVEATGRDVIAHVLAGDTTWLAWLKNHDHEYFHPDRTPVTDATLAISDLPAGIWQMTWIDTWSNADLERSAIVSDGTGAAITLDVPEFARDVALRLDRFVEP
ncbi:MAG: DUF5060 domain-containing protein [bacterium]|nr:DUF5060 domain-containing protein [bacterium]